MGNEQAVEVVRLKELADCGDLEFSDGYRTRKDQLATSGVPILRVAEVLDGRVAPEETDFVSVEFRRKMGTKTSQAGDVLVTTKGTVGRVAQVPGWLTEHVYSPQLCFLRVLNHDRIDSRWLYFFARSAMFQEQVRRFSGQTDMAPYLSLTDLREFEVPLPPITDQRRIAGVLGSLDDLIETNQALIGNLIQASRAIVLRHLSGPLEPLSSILDLRRGIGYRSADFSETTGIPSISMGASSNSGLLKRAKIRLLDRDVPNRYLVEPYDIVMANVDLTWDFGILAWPVVVPEYLGSSVAITSDMYGLRLRTEHADLSIAVWAQLMDDRFRDWVASCAKGTTVASIAQKDVLQFEVRTGVSEAARVAAREMLRLVWSLEEENLSLQQSRNELLPLLMSSRVHVGNVAA